MELKRKTWEKKTENGVYQRIEDREGKHRFMYLSSARKDIEREGTKAKKHRMGMGMLESRDDASIDKEGP